MLLLIYQDKQHAPAWLFTACVYPAALADEVAGISITTLKMVATYFPPQRNMGVLPVSPNTN